MAEDLARHEALEAADDLSLALPLGRAPPDVVDRGPMGPHPHDDDAVEGGIGPPMPAAVQPVPAGLAARGDRKSTRLNSSHANISYAVFCLKKKTKIDK